MSAGVPNWKGVMTTLPSLFEILSIVGVSSPLALVALSAFVALGSALSVVLLPSVVVPLSFLSRQETADVNATHITEARAMAFFVKLIRR